MVYLRSRPPAASVLCSRRAVRHRCRACRRAAELRCATGHTNNTLPNHANRRVPCHAGASSASHTRTTPPQMSPPPPGCSRRTAPACSARAPRLPVDTALSVTPTTLMHAPSARWVPFARQPLTGSSHWQRRRCPRHCRRQHEPASAAMRGPCKSGRWFMDIS